MKRVVYITSDNDWEALYIDGQLVEENEKIGEGEHFTALLQYAKDFNFTIDDVEIVHTNKKGQAFLDYHSYFPDLLNDFKKHYEL